MAGDQGGGAAGVEDTPARPAAPATPPKDDDDGFVDKLRKVLPKLLDEILGPEDEAKPATKAAPQNDRQTEQSFRQQVASVMKELTDERNASKGAEGAPPPAPLQPPQAEVKPWRHRFWGE